MCSLLVGHSVFRVEVGSCFAFLKVGHLKLLSDFYFYMDFINEFVYNYKYLFS